MLQERFNDTMDKLENNNWLATAISALGKDHSIMMKARVSLPHWIHMNTEGCESVVELGAGTLKQIECIHPSVKRIIAIDLHMDYMSSNAINCLRIQGDARNYRELLPTLFNRDCVMLIDFLEHLDTKDAWHLISNLLLDFRRILLMVPEGNHPQTVDITGFGHHEAQTHKSTWHHETVKRLNPSSILYDPYFHMAESGKDNGAIFALWE